MKHPDIRIEIAPEVGELAEEIEHRLLASLRRNVPPSDYAPFVVVARDADGGLAGGLVGSTSYGWLLIKALWVDEEARGRGLGARIMQAAETAAASRGCHGAWLDTSSARAEKFYRKLGFAAFGVLENGPGDLPEGHRRFFMSKWLAPPGRSDADL